MMSQKQFDITLLKQTKSGLEVEIASNCGIRPADFVCLKQVNSTQAQRAQADVAPQTSSLAFGKVTQVEGVPGVQNECLRVQVQLIDSGASTVFNTLEMVSAHKVATKLLGGADTGKNKPGLIFGQQLAAPFTGRIEDLNGLSILTGSNYERQVQAVQIWQDALGDILNLFIIDPTGQFSAQQAIGQDLTEKKQPEEKQPKIHDIGKSLFISPALFGWDKIIIQMASELAKPLRAMASKLLFQTLNQAFDETTLQFSKTEPNNAPVSNPVSPDASSSDALGPDGRDSLFAAWLKALHETAHPLKHVLIQNLQAVIQSGIFTMVSPQAQPLDSILPSALPHYSQNQKQLPSLTSSIVYFSLAQVPYQWRSLVYQYLTVALFSTTAQSQRHHAMLIYPEKYWPSQFFEQTPTFLNPSKEDSPAVKVNLNQLLVGQCTGSSLLFDAALFDTGQRVDGTNAIGSKIHGQNQLAVGYSQSKQGAVCLTGQLTAGIPVYLDHVETVDSNQPAVQTEKINIEQPPMPVSPKHPVKNQQVLETELADELTMPQEANNANQKRYTETHGHQDYLPEPALMKALQNPPQPGPMPQNQSLNQETTEILAQAIKNAEDESTENESVKNISSLPNPTLSEEKASQNPVDQPLPEIDASVSAVLKEAVQSLPEPLDPSNADILDDLFGDDDDAFNFSLEASSAKRLPEETEEEIENAKPLSLNRLPKLRLEELEEATAAKQAENEEDDQFQFDMGIAGEKKTPNSVTSLPDSGSQANDSSSSDDAEQAYQKGTSVLHRQFGQGVIQKVVNVPGGIILNIQFQRVGKRLIDPALNPVEIVSSA